MGNQMHIKTRLYKPEKNRELYRAPMAPLNATSKGTMAPVAPWLVAPAVGPCADALAPTLGRLLSAMSLPLLKMKGSNETVPPATAPSPARVHYRGLCRPRRD